MSTLNKLRRDICEDIWLNGREWISSRPANSTVQSMWDTCPDPDIMLYIASKTCTALDPEKLRLFYCDCAERALPVYEKLFPGDARPRNAIDCARRFARGEATKLELMRAANGALTAAAETAIGTYEMFVAASASLLADAEFMAHLVHLEDKRVSWYGSVHAAAELNHNGAESSYELERLWQANRLRHHIPKI